MASSVMLKTAKKELRTLMKQKLKNISADSINVQSDAIFKSVTSFKPYQEAKRVGIYLSMPTGEVQTDAIVRHALKSGKKVFVPYLHKAKSPSPDTPRSVMEMVDLCSLSDYDLLKRDNWGIPTIGADTVDQREHIFGNPKEESEGLDMILMPGVAFDIDPKTGFVRRLGHGKGFYDFFLHRYRESRESHENGPPSGPGTDVLLYGLALEEQFLGSNTGPSVPVGEHDSLLHGLVVGDGKLLEGPIKRE
ncbi:5-formyltetrahydrofolate cyclo-ligase [Stipitochalara longipes BDJ]|nr:5-formyltetrahydrofolate cyclo-ligase [Stipitochalara longipes BDJ]